MTCKNDKSVKPQHSNKRFPVPKTTKVFHFPSNRPSLPQPAHVAPFGAHCLPAVGGAAGLLVGGSGSLNHSMGNFLKCQTIRQIWPKKKVIFWLQWLSLVKAACQMIPPWQPCGKWSLRSGLQLTRMVASPSGQTLG